MSSPGFLPSYLLPAYEEVVDLPVMPPPPYTPLHPAPPPTDQREESPCLPSEVSVHSSTDAAISAARSHIQSYHNPNKELTPGRYRRFTGDSGIEVCDGQELLDQHRFLDPEEETQGEEMDPCNHCDSQSFEENSAENTVVHNTTAADSESRKWCLHFCSHVPKMDPLLQGSSLQSCSKDGASTPGFRHHGKLLEVNRNWLVVLWCIEQKVCLCVSLLSWIISCHGNQPSSHFLWASLLEIHLLASWGKILRWTKAVALCHSQSLVECLPC